ncbi:MAG: DUF1573 domain-containing protein [Cyclobacteriaceae bacterium]
MNKIAIFLLTIMAGFFAKAQEPAVLEEPVNGAKIVFAEKKHDFGDIKQGDVVEHVFEFENVGNQPLILNQPRTTCGCTTPTWPREPIAPGEKSSITVKFNSRGKIGVINKVVTVTSNAVNNIERISIETNIRLADTEG